MDQTGSPSSLALTRRDIDELRAVGRSRALRPGDVLLQEGDESAAVFVIESGSLRVTAAVDPVGEAELATLFPGSVVGEVTTIAGGMRTATCTAVEPSSVIEVDRVSFAGWLDTHPEAAEAVVELARRRVDERLLVGILAEILRDGGAVLGEIARAAEWVRLDPDDVLFAEGDTSDVAYIVVSGRVAVLDDEGQTVHELGRSEFVGELGFLEGKPRTATVVAARDSTLARFDRSQLEPLFAAHPALMVQVVRLLFSRLSGAARRRHRAATVAVVVTADLDRRVVLSRLIGELERHGKSTHLWSAKVDALLGRPGIAGADATAPGVPRLSEFLHEIETGNEFVLLETDETLTEWTRRAVRSADRVVVVVDVEPDARARELATQVTDLARRGRVKPVWLAVAHPPGPASIEGGAALRRDLHADDIVHVRTGYSEDYARLARLMIGRGVGVVLSGGGARGFAHIGAMRALDDAGVPVDVIGGASIGAPIGGGFALGIPHEDAVATAERLFAGLLDYTIPVVSLVKGERITANIEETFGERHFEDFLIPFFCVSTNLTTSELEIHRTGPAAPAIRASVAIPGVLPPVPRGEDLLVDAGLLNNLPADEMRNLDSVGTVVAVDVAPPFGPRAKGEFGLSVSGWKALRSRLGSGSSTYPAITAVLLRSMMVGASRDRSRMLAGDTIDCYLDLDLRGVGLLDFDAVAAVAAAGYEAAAPRIAAWLEDADGVPTR